MGRAGLAPVGMALFGYLMVQWGFWSEAGKTLRVLEEVSGAASASSSTER
jgi:hypothetical protein